MATVLGYLAFQIDSADSRGCGPADSQALQMDILVGGGLRELGDKPERRQSAVTM